jgi:hypothetical protein
MQLKIFPEITTHNTQDPTGAPHSIQKVESGGSLLPQRLQNLFVGFFDGLRDLFRTMKNVPTAAMARITEVM